MSGLPQLPSRSNLVVALSQTEDEQRELLRLAVLDGRPTHHEDHLVAAALRRSLDNTQGILAMADQANMFCGVPIVRFQIDTAIVLFGRTLVDDVFEYVKHIAEGKERRDFRDRAGKNLTDSHLHKELTKKHPHTTEIYKQASGFVHFSSQHLHRVLDLDLFRQSGEAQFRSVEEVTAGWPDIDIRGALVEFIWATDAIVTECRDWKTAREARPSSETSGGAPSAPTE